MRELDTQIRMYLDEVSEPLTIDEVFAEQVGDAPVRPTAARSVPSRLRASRRGWLVAAAAAVIGLLVIGLPLLLSQQQDESVVTTPSTVASTTTTLAASSTTTTPTTPPTTAPAAGEGESPASTTTTVPVVETVVLDLPVETDGELAYAVIRSLDAPVDLETLATNGEDAAFATASDVDRAYSIEVTLFATAQEAAASLAADVANAPDPADLLLESDELPAPVEFDIPDLDVGRAVTLYVRQCGRGCGPPKMTTGIAFRVDRAVVVVDGRVGEPFEDMLMQQQAVIGLARELDDKTRVALGGELEPIRVAVADSLRSYALNVQHPDRFDVPGVFDPALSDFVEPYSVAGIVLGDDVSCEGDAGPVLRSSDSDQFRLRVQGGQAILTRFDAEAFQAFWATADPDAWWVPLGIPDEFWDERGLPPDAFLAESGVGTEADGTFLGSIDLDMWDDLLAEASVVPPGWIESPAAMDDPLVAELLSRCLRYSPFLSDGIGAAIEGRVGVHSMEFGRDIVSYELDRDAVVALGIIDAGDPIEADMAVIVDAVDPWVHAVAVEVAGSDEALADRFAIIPPYTGRRIELTIRWGFGAFNEPVDLEGTGVESEILWAG